MTVPTSDIAETVDMELVADSIDSPDEKEMPGQKTPAVAEPQPEGHVIGEYPLENPELNVAHEIIQTEQPFSLSHIVEHVDAKPTTPAVDNMLDSDSESESESDDSSSSDSDSGSKTEKTVVEHQPQSIVQPAASSSHAPEESGHPLDHKNDSDSLDDSAEEFPPSSSAAFAKKNPSPYKVPITTRESDTGSRDLSDSSDDTDMSTSSEDEGDPRSPTIEVSRHAGQHQQPMGNGSLVITSALPSSDLSSSSSSESDSEDSSSDEEGKLSSKALSQVSKILEARACPEVGLPTVDEEKAISLTNARTIPQRSPSLSAKKSEVALSSSSGDSDSESDGSSSDDLSTEVQRSCPKCGKILPVEGVQNNTTTSQPKNKTETKPVVVSTPPVQSNAANRHQTVTIGKTACTVQTTLITLLLAHPINARHQPNQQTVLLCPKVRGRGGATGCDEEGRPGLRRCNKPGGIRCADYLTCWMVD